MRVLLIVFTLMSLGLFGQGEIGDALFDNFEYSKAIKYYNNDADLTLNQKENLAYSYFVTQDFVNAEKYYQEIVASDDVEPVFYQFYGISLRNNGKYDEAKINFEKLLEIDSSYLISKVALKGLNEHKELVGQPQKLEAINLSGINNGAASYAPRYFNDGILFCSELINDSLKRRPKIDINDDFTEVNELAYGVAERPLSAIFYAELLGSEVKKVEPYLSSDKFHIGNFTLNDSLKQIIFTKVDLNKQWDPNARKHPRLFSTPLNGILITNNAERLGVKKLSNEVGSGHPELTADGKVLYFSSDKPGGFGGSDLYMSKLTEDGKWSEPINLGAKINTAGDELSPYIYKNEYLYFSSNGHIGYGGLDILKIHIDSMELTTPSLLSQPINSISDDYGLLIDPMNPDNGFITSNRLGGMGDDDIYAFRLKLEGVFVQGVVKDLNGNLVANALIKIYDQDGNEVGQTRTDENGRYIIELDDEGDYQVIASIPGFADKEIISINEDWDNHSILEMVLEPTNTAQGIVRNEDGTIADSVKIELKDDQGNVLFSAITDENGYYQFPLFEENTTYIAEATDGSKRGSEIFVTDDNFDSEKETDIVLSNKGTFVEGIVLNEDGSPASGVDVNLYDSQGSLIASTLTDKNGNYHFDLDKDKDYQILAVTDGFEALQNIFTGDKYDSSNKLNLQLEPIGKESFALVADNDTKIGISDVRVTLVDDETGNKITTKTDAEGKFTFRIKPKHSYTINLEKEGYYPRSVKIEAGKKLPEKVDLNKLGDFGMDYAGYDVDKIYFELDSYVITDASKLQVDKIVEVLSKNRKATVTIKSYADCRGPEKYNISLSYKRSKAVKEYLIQNGVKGNRILTESLGASNFVNNCTTGDACSENEHALNRRSEFEIDFRK